MTTLEEKVAALRALAASARKLGNVHEADAAEAAAKRIEAKLPAKKAPAVSAEMGQDDAPLFWTDLGLRSWPFHLALLVANACGVALLSDDTDRKGSAHYGTDKPARWRVVYFGEAGDRRDARTLFEEMTGTVKQAVRERSFVSQRAKEAFALKIADALGRSIRCHDMEKKRTISDRRRRAVAAAREIAVEVKDRTRETPHERVTVRHARR